MVRTDIKVDAYTDNDPYIRYLGKAIDQILNRNFWDTQPENIVGLIYQRKIHEQTVDLPAGSHSVAVGVSAWDPYYWHVKVYINGRLKDEGDVSVGKGYLTVDFTVEEEVPPTPPPSPGFWESLEDWQKVAIIIGIPASILGVGLMSRR